MESRTARSDLYALGDRCVGDLATSEGDLGAVVMAARLNLLGDVTDFEKRQLCGGLCDESSGALNSAQKTFFS